MRMVWLFAAFILFTGLFLYNRYQFRQAETAYPPNGEFVTVEGVRLHYIAKVKASPSFSCMEGFSPAMIFKT